MFSVRNAFDSLGADVIICSRPDELDRCDRLVLPGVGAFGDYMHNMTERGFTAAIALEKSKPLLGICLGMQVMARRGYESGDTEGLGRLDAEVARIDPGQDEVRIPHVGWNDLTIQKPSPLLKGIPAGADFYFVHSYTMRCFDPSDVVATCAYGGGVTAAVCRDNMFATQFHPEKSQEHGLRLLENFLEWSPC